MDRHADRVWLADLQSGERALAEGRLDEAQSCYERALTRAQLLVSVVEEILKSGQALVVITLEHLDALRRAEERRQAVASTRPETAGDPPRRWQSLPTDEPFRL